MSKAGALDLATGLGGKMDKSEVLSAVDQYVGVSWFFCSKCPVKLCSVSLSAARLYPLFFLPFTLILWWSDCFDSCKVRTQKIICSSSMHTWCASFDLSTWVLVCWPLIFFVSFGLVDGEEWRWSNWNWLSYGWRWFRFRPSLVFWTRGFLFFFLTFFFLERKTWSYSFIASNYIIKNTRPQISWASGFLGCGRGKSDFMLLDLTWRDSSTMSGRSWFSHKTFCVIEASHST